MDRPHWYDDPRMAWLDEVDPRQLAAITDANGPIPPPERTLGPAWCRWIETNCRLGEGDAYGKPIRLIPWQRAYFWKLGEIDETGRRVWNFSVLSLGKGSGKSPVGGCVGSLSLAGPAIVCGDEECEACDGGFRSDGTPHAVRRTSPDVLVMASSYEQADLILDEIRTTFTEGPLAPHATAMKGLVELVGERGKARRIPATVRKADGTKATDLLVDEAHELTTDRQENAYQVAAGGTAKRGDGLTGLFSTAGHDLSTMFGKIVARGLRRELDPGDLFVYLQAQDGLDPSKDADIRKGILQANPLAAAGVANVDSLVKQFKAMPVYRGKRYFWNQWVPSDESWLPTGAWDACKGDLIIDPTLPTWLGADMALKRDSAAVVMLQLRPDGRLQASARIWFPDGGLIDQTEVDDYIRSVNETHNVQWNAADEAWWPTLTELEAEGLPIFRMPQQGRNMVIAYAQTYRVIVDGVLIQDGAPDFADQIASAVPNSSDRGWTLKKGKTKRRIDSCPALAGAVFARNIPTEPVEKTPPRSAVY
jgi:phage terminase large subunit-like protein